MKLKRKVAALLAVAMVVTGQPTGILADGVNAMFESYGATKKDGTTPSDAEKASEEEKTELEIEVNVYPNEDAAKVSVPNKLESGDELEFKVKIKEGYRLDSVDVSGDELEGDYDEESDRYIFDAGEMLMDPQINVYLDEIEYPEFDEEYDVDGVKFTVQAKEGILPEGTQVEIEKLEDIADEDAPDYESAKNEVLKKLNFEDEQEPIYGAYRFTLKDTDDKLLSDKDIKNKVTVSVTGISELSENSDLFDIGEPNPLPTEVYKVEKRSDISMPRLFTGSDAKIVGNNKALDKKVIKTADSSMKLAENAEIAMFVVTGAADEINADLLVDLYADETVTVYIALDGELKDEPTEIKIGEVAGNIPEIEGYEFIKATIDDKNDSVLMVGSWNDYIYYTTEDSGNTAMLLKSGEKIVLNYETYKEDYAINYDVQAGVVWEGPETVEAGSSYTFTVEPSGLAKNIVVLINDNDVTDSGVIIDSTSGRMSFTISNVFEDQNIVIKETDVSSYVFTYNNENIRQGNITEPESGTSVKTGGSISFKLKSDNWTGLTDIDGHKWHLNLLAINNEYVNVPTTFNVGDSAETILSTGETVKIQLTGEGGRLWYNKYHEYTVTVSNIYHNIDVTDGNFKDDERDEIILKTLDGVSEIQGWDCAQNDGRGGYVKGSLNSVYLQTKRTGNEFYFNLTPGYTEPKVTVLANGEETGISVRDTSEMSKDEYTIEGDYSYQFNVPNNLSDNVEVYITSEIEEYHVEYIVDGEVSSTITDTNGPYTILPERNNQTVITSSVPEYNAKQYVFEGWEYNGKLYDANEVFIFDSNTVVAAENGVIKFKAKLTPIAGSEYVSYTVKYWFQNDDYSGYIQKLDEYPDENRAGIKGSEVFSYDILNKEISGYVLNEDSDIVFELTDNSDINIINIYFDLDKNNDDKTDKEQLQVVFDLQDTGTSFTGITESDEVKVTETTVTYWYNLNDSYIDPPSASNISGIQADKVFGGWENSGTTYENYVLTNSITDLINSGINRVVFTPKFNDNTVTLTFNSNGATGQVPSAEYIKNTTADLSKVDISSLKYGTNVFVGWSTEPADVIKNKEDDKEITFIEEILMDSDKEIYAVWAADSDGDGIPDYKQYVKITFEIAEGDKSKGSFASADPAKVELSLKKGSKMPNVPVTDTENDGWVFDGWNPVLPDTVP